MKEAVLLLVLSAVCSASYFKLVSVPKTVSLTSTSIFGLRSSDLAQLNANLLGLSTDPVSGFEVNSDLFSRPRAIAIVRLDGVDNLEYDGSSKYELVHDKFELSSLNEQLANSFGADREFATTDHKGVSGSAIAQTAMEQNVKEEIKTKLPVLHDELENMYRLADALTAQGAKFEKSNTADVFYVKIGGAAGRKLTDEQREAIKAAIEKLSKALSTVYGDQAILEVVVISNPIKYEENHEEKALVRRKRAAEMTDTETNLKTWREKLNVYSFCSTDYPAMFAIFAGLTIVLILAVLYTVVAMMSMDPSKDSIIYRMTTTRMKKA